jgi:hypothetical protein
MIQPEDAIISQVTTKFKPLKPTEVLLNRLDKLDKKYRTGIRNWLASDKETNYNHEKMDYEQTVKDIDSFNPEDSAKIFEGWDRQPELSVALIDKIEVLKGLQPVNQSVTLFGVDDRPPSLFEQKKWLVYVKVFNAPESLLDSLNAGLLSGLEVEALKLMYPSILEAVQSGIIEGISELQGKGVTSIGSKKLELVNKLLEVPRLSPEKLQSLQAQFAEEEEGTDIDVDSEGVQTDTQRIEHK